MAETAIIRALITALFTNLSPLIKNEVSLLWNFREEVKKLLSTLSSIDAVLEDAEMKAMWEKSKQTENWLRKLKHVGYEIRDITEELTLEDLRLQVKRLNASSSTLIQVTNSIVHPLNNIWIRRNMGHKIKDIQKKLDQISYERTNLHLQESNHYSKPVSWRQTMSNLSEKVYGRDGEKKEIVHILVHSSNEAKEVSVLPILGLGGLGKTTLAQLIFNNKEVTDHFDPKIWVCVSEKFDIKLIIKAIIGETPETSLEKLQNMIQDKLKGKKFLLVLDDVWNDNDEQWKRLRSILNCGSSGAFILTTTRKKIVAEIMKTVETFNLSQLSEDDCWLLLEERAFLYGILKIVNFIDIGKAIAKKCNGNPLAAKTLGSQLNLKNDEKEWCRIRDSEMWEISKDEKSILPILRLSYYDLPYYLRRCFAFCAIFSKDTEIEKERLIQWWIAHDLIPSNTNQELEDNGNLIWDELCWRSFFQEEKLNWKGVRTCKMHDLMHDLTQFVMKDEFYTMDDKSTSKDLGREIRHVTIMVNEGKELPFASLKNKGGLQSIILHSNYNKKVSKDAFSVVKEFSSLRVFEVPKYEESLDLHYVGCLKHLRYLNLSHNKMIKILPDSICNLLNLHTLNLNNCKFLENLPKNTRDLINLRNFFLEGCDKLKYMPRGMGQLRNLKILSLFVIGKESDGQLDELKELDIRGYLEIRNLDNVSDASIARGISMSKKSSISELELYWNDMSKKSSISGFGLYWKDMFANKKKTSHSEKKARHEKIGEALEVTTTYLKRLRISGYKGVNIPKWVGESSASLMKLCLVGMDNVEYIFTMNNMNTSCEIRMPVSFPLLEELEIKEMKNLRELVSPAPIPITTTRAFPKITEMKNLRELVKSHPPIPITIRAFPNLSKLSIHNCPKLGALPPHIKSLKYLKVYKECSNELLNSISNLSSLNLLVLQDMHERSVLFGAANNNALMFDDDDEITLVDNNEAQARGPSAFQSLRELEIYNCSKLRCLF